MDGTVRAWTRHHPHLLDGTVAVAVFLVNLPIQAAYVPAHPPHLDVVLSAGLCLPYLARRNHPTGVFAAMALTALVQWWLGVLPTYSSAMLLLALHNLAARGDRRVSVAAAATLEAGVAATLLRWESDPRQYAFNLLTCTVLIATVWVWGRTTGVRRAYVAALEERTRLLECEREHRARLAAAEERARIAREMHDVVSHGLSVMVVQADGAAHSLRARPDLAEQALETIRGTGRAALTEMRHMLGVLRQDGTGDQPYAPQPGLDRLDQLVADARGSGLPVELTVAGNRRNLPPGVELAAYRVVQEALTNIRRHAGPARARVRLRMGDDALEIRVCDDGRGAPAPPGARPGTGHGLVGMRERVAAHGGSLRVGPRADGGFEVVASLPLDAPDPCGSRTRAVPPVP